MHSGDEPGTDQPVSSPLHKTSTPGRSTCPTSRFPCSRNMDRIQLKAESPFLLENPEKQNKVARARLSGKKVDRDVPIAAHPARDRRPPRLFRERKNRFAIFCNGPANPLCLGRAIA